MEFYERVSGARMHAAFYRPNEMSINYITSTLLKDIVFFCRDLFQPADTNRVNPKLNRNLTCAPSTHWHTKS